MDNVQGLDIQWSSSKITLKEALNKKEFPKVLQVGQKYVINSSECLYEEERIVVHGTKTVAQLRGKDSKGRQVTFPIACPFEVKFGVLDAGQVYKTVGDLCAANPVPKCVKMTGNVKGEEVQSLQKDEKMKVLLTEKNDKGPSFVHFRSETGKHLRLSVAFEGNFVSCPADDNIHTFDELATKDLPLCIEFCSTNGKYPFDKQLGRVVLSEGLTSEFVFAATKRKGKVAALILPLSCDLKVHLATSVQNPQGDQVDLSEGIELQKFNSHLARHMLENVGGGILVQYDGMGEPVSSHGSLKAQKSDENREASPQPTPEATPQPTPEVKVKRRESDSTAEKKIRAVKEKAMRRMSKAKMLGKKGKHKSMDKEVKGESERPEIVVLHGEAAGQPDNNHEPYTGGEFIEIENTEALLAENNEGNGGAVEDQEEDMYLPPTEVKRENGLDTNSAVNAPLYDDVEPDPPANGDITNGHCEDEYEVPETSQFVEDDYEAPTDIMPPATLPRDGKDKSDKGIFSKMWKKVKKGATLPAMSGAQVKKLQKHSDSDEVEGRGRAPSDVSSPSSPPEMIPTFDDEDEDLYEEIGESYLSSDLIKAARTAHRYSFSMAPLPPKPMDSGDSGFGDEDFKELERLRASVPPELPSNHPLARSSEKGGTLKFKDFFAGVKKSEEEIRKWGLDEVEKTLRQLCLQDYVDQFIDNQIDGTLLVDLDEAVFRDLGMTAFEARKVRKFVFGWRPDCMQSENYCGLKKLDSLDASDWQDADVAEHLKVLAMADFADFCSRNQVNGDLLKDIVADDEVLNDVLKGADRRLKTVKLKKYVLEGWRPQSKIYETHDAYEAPSPVQSSGQEKKVESDSVVHTKVTARTSADTTTGKAKSEQASMTKTTTATKNERPSSTPVKGEQPSSTATKDERPSSAASGADDTIACQGKVRQARDTFRKQASHDSPKLGDRKLLKDSPLIANIKQQLMEKSGTKSR